MYLASKRKFVGRVPARPFRHCQSNFYNPSGPADDNLHIFLPVSSYKPHIEPHVLSLCHQSTCQRSEPACSCSSFRTGWTWVGVGSTWYVVPYPPLSLLTLTPLSSRGVLLVLQSPFILTRSAAETVLHPHLVSDCLASRFKLYKASDTTSDSSQICRVLTQMPYKLIHK